MALGSFIGAGRSLDSAVERVQRAERLGYESVYVTHIGGRDSITLLPAPAPGEHGHVEVVAALHVPTARQ